MTATPVVPSADPARSAAPDGLSRDSIGVAGIVFFIIAAAAPLTVVIALFPVIMGSGNGVGTAGAFLLVAAVLLVFAVGYVAMSRHVRNAGAFYSYVSLGLGRPLGLGAAGLAIFGYNAIQLGLYGGIGYYAHELVTGWIGVDLPWWLYSLVALAACLALGANHIHSGARVLGVLLFLETVVIVVLDVAILVNSPTPASQWSFDPISPTTVFAGAIGVALMFAHASFIGFEGSAIYSEEARDPRRTVPRATYIAVVFMGVFYAITAFLIVNSLGVGNAVGVAQDSGGDLVFVVSDSVLGGWMTGAFRVLIITSMFAAIVTFHNNVARYLFSLGRQGALPAALGRTHARKQSPVTACVVQTVMVGLVIVVFAIAGLDPYAALFTWMTGIGAVGIILLQFVASIAVFVWFRRTNHDKRVWNTVIAPLLGIAGLAPFLWFALTEIDVLLGTGGWLAALLVGLVFLSLLGATVWGLWLKRARPAVYDGLLTGVGDRA
ncbi:APC family permease [Pseudonocardia halophobica]|uniref:Amino acid permease n=1 Tax=Pseudonocardia halophobica TaxID=29401 RepID=A0A9W6L979_9PSEU|nr:APC family permease [Pseudonocardia halophobica]GLL14016.1 amino acid permease [Pseudonocardia halophobica]